MTEELRKRVRRALLPILWGCDEPPARDRRRAADFWRIPIAENDAAIMLDELADAAIATIIEALSDPGAVHVNMLRGTVAKPTLDQIRHLYPELRTNWLPLPPVPVPGVAPWDGANYPLVAWGEDTRKWSPVWHGAWRNAGPRAGWRWQASGMAVPFRPTHYHALAPLPSAPAVEG